MTISRTPSACFRHTVDVSADQLTIVPAQLADAADIHTIKLLAFAEEGRLCGSVEIPPLQEDLASVESDIRSHTVLVARLDDRIVGSARGTVSGDSCEIRAVCVHPAFHGRGIGAGLMRAIERAHPAVSGFRLTTNTLVPGNVAFYERRGYHVVGHTRFTETIVLAHLAKDTNADSAEQPQPTRTQATSYS